MELLQFPQNGNENLNYEFTFPVVNDPSKEVTVRLPVINDDNKSIVILSGGLDSTILTNLLANVAYDPTNNLLAVSFNYNQRHKVELTKAAKTCELLHITHKIINIEFLSDLVANVSALSGQKIVDVPNMDQIEDPSQPQTYVPFRNQLFLTLAASLAESNDCKNIFIGAQSGDLYGYWDCSSTFMERFNQLISLNHKHQITIHAPFAKLSKADEICIGVALNVDFKNTHTCYRGVDVDGKSCGTCPTCTERLNNFRQLGLEDPIEYI